jgi:holo-[acyl-carrier protein] synthase
VSEIVGVGVDLCDVDRVRLAIARTSGFVDRVYTGAEQQYCRQARDPAERFAARFAAKEAVLKAMGAGLGSSPLRAIEVVRASSGAPSVVLHGAAASLAAERGITDWKLSLTHTRTLAEAVAIALGG